MQGAQELMTVQLAKAESRGLDEAQGIKMATDVVRAQYPVLFDDAPQPKRNARPRQASERSAAPRTNEKKLTLKDLDPGLRTVAARAIRATRMSEHEYVKQIIEG